MCCRMESISWAHLCSEAALRQRKNTRVALWLPVQPMNRAQWSWKTRQFGQSDGNNEKSIVMLPESNLQGGEREGDRGVAGVEERIKESKRREGGREWAITHARRPGIGFVFMSRWLHINLCKWRLWLYFHRASREGTTGLLPEKERDGENAAMNTAEREFSLFIGTACGFQPEHQPQICHNGRTDLLCRVKKKKNQRLRDEEKSSEEERKWKPC